MTTNQPQPVATQLVVDCTDPLALAHFWTMALNWVMEPAHDFVKSLADAGTIGPDDYQVDTDGSFYFAGLVAIHHPRGRDGGRILFQRVPEPKTVKNRLHLDLNVGRDSITDEIDRLVAAGATHVGTYDRPEGFWAAMRDPEGNEFDLQ